LCSCTCMYVGCLSGVINDNDDKHLQFILILQFYSFGLYNLSRLFTVTLHNFIHARFIAYCLVSRLSHESTWFFMSRSWLCLDTILYVSSWLVSRVSMSRHVSCLVTVSWLWLCEAYPSAYFCVETLAFLAESRPLGPFSCCLRAAKRLFLWLFLFCGYSLSW